MERLRIGISQCLMGDRVRYDGQHKRDAFLVDTLGKYVEYVPVCPEVECGLPVPREAMRLVGSTAAPRLMTQRTGIDHTERMQSWARRRVVELEQEGLCGFIFKSKSPSSGMERVKVYNGRGGLSGRAPGMFAKIFMEHFPLLPVEEEGRLNDVNLRENFIERVFTLQRYREAMGARPTTRALTEFQARHKLLLMAHSPEDTRVMGRLLGQLGKRGVTTAVSEEYEERLLRTLQKMTTLRKHTNVLQHAMGYLKQVISPDEKQELLDVIQAFRDGMVPLIVPVTLLAHYTRKHAIGYLQEQVYFQPHPLELKLRNHA